MGKHSHNRITYTDINVFSFCLLPLPALGNVLHTLHPQPPYVRQRCKKLYKGHIALIKEKLQKWNITDMSTNSLHSLESIRTRGKRSSKDKINRKKESKGPIYSDLHCIIHNYITDTFIPK